MSHYNLHSAGLFTLLKYKHRFKIQISDKITYILITCIGFEIILLRRKLLQNKNHTSLSKIIFVLADFFSLYCLRNESVGMKFITQIMYAEMDYAHGYC